MQYTKTKLEKLEQDFQYWKDKLTAYSYTDSPYDQALKKAHTFKLKQAFIRWNTARIANNIAKEA